MNARNEVLQKLHPYSKGPTFAQAPAIVIPRGKNFARKDVIPAQSMSGSKNSNDLSPEGQGQRQKPRKHKLLY